MTLTGPPDLLPGLGPVDDAIALPPPAGRISRFTDRVLREPSVSETVDDIVAADATDPLRDLDFQRSLFVLHQLHDRGIVGAHPNAEWHPTVVHWWHRLAGRFEAALRAEVPIPAAVVGPMLPMLGAISRRTTPEPAPTPLESLHRDEVRRHPLARARVEMAATLADTAPPAAPTHGSARTRLDVTALPLAVLTACNLTTHLALHRRLLPALLGHLAWYELTSPADPFGGPTNVTVADAYLEDHPADRPLALWGAEVTAAIDARRAAAV